MAVSQLVMSNRVHNIKMNGHEPMTHQPLSQHARQCNAVLWTTPLSYGNMRFLDPAPP
jgi:hypothetical protein